MNRNSQFQNLLDFLISVKNNHDPLIFRKEIAAWSAVILYLPILFAFYNFVKGECNNSVLIICMVFIVIICGLFLLFLNKQYDSIFNLVAERRVLSRWIFRIIGENKIPCGFDFEVPENRVLPKELCIQIDHEQSIIRKSKHIKIFGVAWKVAYKFLQKIKKENGHPYTNTEIQESIIYNIIIFFTLFDLFYKKWPLFSI